MHSLNTSIFTLSLDRSFLAYYGERHISQQKSYLKNSWVHNADKRNIIVSKKSKNRKNVDNYVDKHTLLWIKSAKLQKNCKFKKFCTIKLK